MSPASQVRTSPLNRGKSIRDNRVDFVTVGKTTGAAVSGQHSLSQRMRCVLRGAPRVYTTISGDLERAIALVHDAGDGHRRMLFSVDYPSELTQTYSKH